jgi:hypothetical protein
MNIDAGSVAVLLFSGPSEKHVPCWETRTGVKIKLLESLELFGRPLVQEWFWV